MYLHYQSSDLYFFFYKVLRTVKTVSLGSLTKSVAIHVTVCLSEHNNEEKQGVSMAQ